MRLHQGHFGGRREVGWAGRFPVGVKRWTRWVWGGYSSDGAELVPGGCAPRDSEARAGSGVASGGFRKAREFALRQSSETWCVSPHLWLGKTFSVAFDQPARKRWKQLGRSFVPHSRIPRTLRLCHRQPGRRLRRLQRKSTWRRRFETRWRAGTRVPTPASSPRSSLCSVDTGGSETSWRRQCWPTQCSRGACSGS